MLDSQVDIQQAIPDVPRIVNIARLRATTRKPTLLHFTEEQWNALTGDLLKVDRLDQDQILLSVVTMPSAPKVMFLATPVCPPDCTPMYEYRGRTPETFERILIDCICAIPPMRCRLGFVFADPLLRFPRLACIDSAGKICRDEKVALISHSPTHQLLGCVLR